MAIDGLNVNNNLALYKVAKSKGAENTSGTGKLSLFNSNDPVMSKNGSIFNGHIGNSTSAQANNTVKRYQNNNHEPFPEKKSSNNSGTNISESNAKSKLSEAKALNNKMTGQVTDVKAKTTAANQNAKASEDMANKAQQDRKAIQKDQKTFEKEMKSLENQNKEATKQMQSAMQKQEAATQRAMDIQSQIMALDASENFDDNGFNKSAYSLTLAGDSEGIQRMNQNRSQNTERLDLMAELDRQMGVSEQYGNKVYTLSCKSSRYVQRMQTLGNAYTVSQNKMQNTMQVEQQKNSEFLDFALEAEQISTAVTTLGQVAQGIGKALMACGAIPYVGAALVTIGQVLDKGGMIAKTAGQYGTCAANVAKTAAYAADGRWTEALQSAGTAIVAGAAAAKSTKNFQTEWKNSTIQANAGKAKAEAVKQARAQVEQNGGIEGMSDRQARKAIQADILGNTQVDENGFTIADGQAEKSWQNVNNSAQDVIKASTTDSNGNAIEGITDKQIRQNVKATFRNDDGLNAKNVAKFEEAQKQALNELKSFKELDSITKGISTTLNSSAAMMSQFMPQQNMMGMGGYATNPMMGNYRMSGRAQNIIMHMQHRQAAFA